MSEFQSILHVAACMNHYTGVIYTFFVLHLPRHGPVKFDNLGQLKFLTNWNMCLQAVYFTICVLNDFIGTNEISPRCPPLIRKIKDYMLCTVAFPVSMFVGLTFWGLYAIDRELVFPKALDPYFPTWLNHVMHTNIMIFIILEMVLSYRKYPSRSSGTKGLTTFMCVYLAWTFIIYFYTGAWVYPVCDVLNWPQRAVFFILLLLFVNALYFAGECLNNTIWEKKLCQLQRSGSRRSD